MCSNLRGTYCLVPLGEGGIKGGLFYPFYQQHEAVISIR
jgi:hypothetical protein